jgi:hypothetical protein
MALQALLARAAKAAALAEEIDASAAALSAADNEATTVLSLAAVLARLQEGGSRSDRSGVQVLDASVGSRGETVLICAGDPDEEISEIVRGPWMIAPADEEVSEIITGPWTEPVERRFLAPGELEAAILEADEEDSEIIPGPWLADEEATCFYNQADIEALLNR